MPTFPWPRAGPPPEASQHSRYEGQLRVLGPWRSLLLNLRLSLEQGGPWLLRRPDCDDSSYTLLTEYNPDSLELPTCNSAATRAPTNVTTVILASSCARQPSYTTTGLTLTLFNIHIKAYRS